ncbi:MAG: hypothetical protein KUG74_00545 [Rhodobacteraceae bacterium]|nr:hypothetical protein [Paracoccaceae bacterium]
MNRKIAIAGLAVLAFGSSVAVWAQTTPSHTMQHTEGMTHEGMSHNMPTITSGPIPTEPGQGAFAAMMEIVTLLRADPETDWNRVDIDGLRQHLVDMDMLITNTEVSTKKVNGGLQMTASRNGFGGGAVSRMVPAHGPVLAADTGWNSNVQVDDNSVVWTVTSDQDFYIIQALGFFGLMTIGDHHQAHHIGMAKGEMVHNHE